MDLRQKFTRSVGLLVGVVGAFNPVDTNRFLPILRALLPALKGAGVEFIGCVSVNDQYVLKAWAKKLRITSDIIFVSDVNCALTRALGFCDDSFVDPAYGNILARSHRYILLVGPDSKVNKVAVGQEVLEHGVYECICAKLGIPVPEGLASLFADRIEELTSPLFNFNILESHRDEAHPHITFNYSEMNLCDNYTVNRDPTGLTIVPYGESFGCINIDWTRPDVLHDTSITSDRTRDIEFKIERVFITRGMALNIPAISEKIEALVIVEHTQTKAPAIDQKAYVVFPLASPGRDVLLFNIPEENGVVKLESLKDPENGLDINHFVSTDLRFYRFRAKCAWLTSTNETATWFVASEVAYASENQLQKIGSERIDAVPSSEIDLQSSILLAACEVL